MTRRTSQLKKLTMASAVALAVLIACLSFRRWYHGVPYWLESHNEAQLLPLIDQAASRHSLAPELIRAVVWKESRFNQFSVGSKGEIGLMQIMPGAVQDWARVNNKDVPGRVELFIPEVNIEIGSWYLAQAAQHWDGYMSQNVLLLAEYNAGRTNVLRNWAPKSPEEIVQIDDISFPGTREYVRLILDRKRKYERERESSARR